MAIFKKINYKIYLLTYWCLFAGKTGWEINDKNNINSPSHKAGLVNKQNY